MSTAYEFVIHEWGEAEALGVMQLENDAQAILFGKDIVRDLMHGATLHYAGFTMDITERGRVVRSFPFDPTPNRPS